MVPPMLFFVCCICLRLPETYYHPPVTCLYFSFFRERLQHAQDLRPFLSIGWWSTCCTQRWQFSGIRVAAMLLFGSFLVENAHFTGVTCSYCLPGGTYLAELPLFIAETFEQIFIGATFFMEKVMSNIYRRYELSTPEVTPATKSSSHFRKMRTRNQRFSRMSLDKDVVGVGRRYDGRKGQSITVSSKFTFLCGWFKVVRKPRPIIVALFY